MKTKRFVSTIVLSMTVFVAMAVRPGCLAVGVKLDSDTRVLVARIAAQTLGYEAAKRYPDIVVPATLFRSLVATTEDAGMADA